MQPFYCQYFFIGLLGTQLQKRNGWHFSRSKIGKRRVKQKSGSANHFTMKVKTDRTCYNLKSPYSDLLSLSADELMLAGRLASKAALWPSLKAAVAALAANILKNPRICSKSKYLHISYTPYKSCLSYIAAGMLPQGRPVQLRSHLNFQVP